MLLNGERGIDIKRRISNCKLLIIDEISAITIGLLSQSNKRLQSELGNNGFFGNISAILIVGDFRQLPPGQGASVLVYILRPKFYFHRQLRKFHRTIFLQQERAGNDPVQMWK